MADNLKDAAPPAHIPRVNRVYVNRFVCRRKVVEQYRKLPKRKRRTCRERSIAIDVSLLTSPFCNAAQLITQVAVINEKTSSIVYNVHPNFVSKIFHPSNNHTPQRILENNIL
ncbi:unnamed protein product [Hermetia illucens]|uniref:Uncharacterized protein n=1 Tax=Hermetia illucens TaxID=343691 RepID=A0A7R8UAV0_HERIL|nr:uncharacterized protein LOC119646896 [Hermetia illucens]CAD7077372.1 unnamed protein product [Hermetia illucens]